MQRQLCRAIVGSVAGAIGSVALVATVGPAAWSILLGVTIGAGFALTGVNGDDSDQLMTGGALGVPLWAVLSIVVFPLLSHEAPEWSAEGMRQHFPALVGWVLYGVILGLVTRRLNALANCWLRPEQATTPETLTGGKHVVILGGGFAGMKTAEYLERELRNDPSVRVSLISETNALLFTPMLAEVAGSSLEPSHISTPLRTALHRSEFIRGRVASVDFENKQVVVESQSSHGEAREITYDHLVFALGAVSNYLGLTNVQKLAFDFKTLVDAIKIRNHLIEMFERADREHNPEVRKSLLTFVIAGGGFAGVELAGALNDFARGIVADYPHLDPNDIRVVLVHSRDRILPELSEALGRYAQKKMQERGVEFRMNARLTDARPGTVVLSDGEISAETLVWTAGTAPNPLTKKLGLETDKRGAITVDAMLAVQGKHDVWALGDCAAVVDAKTGKPCPPTAQFAIREAAALARNIRLSLENRSSRSFHFDSLGALCVIGHQTACAELTVPFTRRKSLRFSGLLAWFMWRSIYLAKLPGLERKIRVVVDWTVELFFPKDIVQTIELQ